MSRERGRILVVDDHPTSRLKLTLGLRRQGHTVAEAEHGVAALEALRAEPFDLVLLDILMPEMDGYEVLARMKSDPALHDVPVIVISAQDELESVVRGIELGAEDYLPKSFEPVLLGARINACLEKKRLRDEQRAFVRELEVERERSERLLLDILPRPIAERLKRGEAVIADHFASVSVLFADIVDFTALASQQPPVETVRLLNDVFSAFDELTERHGLEKIKTIGDAYMAAGGLQTPREDHVPAMAAMALAMRDAAAGFRRSDGAPLQLRIGIHAGPVVAGVIGIRKFIYDLWGDTVNIASRMESQGIAGEIQVTAAVRERLDGTFVVDERGDVDVKGVGPLRKFLLRGHRGA